MSFDHFQSMIFFFNDFFVCAVGLSSTLAHHKLMVSSPPFSYQYFVKF